MTISLFDSKAEYLPVGRLHSPTVDGTSELLSNMLTALLHHGQTPKRLQLLVMTANGLVFFLSAKMTKQQDSSQ